MIRRMIAVTRTFGKELERRLFLIRWGIPRRSKGLNYTAHILVVKNPVYLRIGKIAIGSFLYHNPGSRVLIHCDPSTRDAAFTEYRYYLKRNLVHIIEAQSESGTWQLQKIELLEMIANQEKHFYMDCDVRWNDSLDLPEKCAYYVSEFKLIEKSPFRELLSSLDLFDQKIQMMNTTFVYLYPGCFTSEELLKMRKLHNQFQRTCASGNVAKLDVEVIERLSEQLAFSVFLSQSGKDHVALKSKDGHRDGSFLESSYFGATGVQF